MKLLDLFCGAGGAAMGAEGPLAHPLAGPGSWALMPHTPPPRPSPDHTIPTADVPRWLLPPELPPWLLTPSDQQVPTGWVHRRP